jgi:DNA-binding PadR family transcriptional regulator
MPGDRGAAEPARYALLGLLLSGPSHGYELARQFSTDSALGDVIHLSPSHLYALLGRLERDGMIAGEQQEAGNRPTRRVYHLTSAGREAILQWLDEPVDHPRDMRIEFPLKFYLARLLDPQRAADLVEQQRRTFKAYIQRLEELPLGGATEDDMAFRAAMRAGRIGRAQAALDWLDDSAESLLARRE